MQGLLNFIEILKINRVVNLLFFIVSIVIISFKWYNSVQVIHKPNKKMEVVQ